MQLNKMMAKKEEKIVTAATTLALSLGLGLLLPDDDDESFQCWVWYHLLRQKKVSDAAAMLVAAMALSDRQGYPTLVVAMERLEAFRQAVPFICPPTWRRLPQNVVTGMREMVGQKVFLGPVIKEDDRYTVNRLFVPVEGEQAVLHTAAVVLEKATGRVLCDTASVCELIRRAEAFWHKEDMPVSRLLRESAPDVVLSIHILASPTIDMEVNEGVTAALGDGRDFGQQAWFATDGGTQVLSRATGEVWDGRWTPKEPARIKVQAASWVAVLCYYRRAFNAFYALTLRLLETADQAQVAEGVSRLLASAELLPRDAKAA